MYMYYKLAKNFVSWICSKKFMQIEVDEICMDTRFGGHGLSGFGDIPTFKFWPIFPFRPWSIVHGGQKIESAQKIHASGG